MVYTEEVKGQLQQLGKVIEELIKEESEKPIEQFIAEVQYVKYLLNEVESLATG